MRFLLLALALGLALLPAPGHCSPSPSAALPGPLFDRPPVLDSVPADSASDLPVTAYISVGSRAIFSVDSSAALSPIDPLDPTAHAAKTAGYIWDASLVLAKFIERWSLPYSPEQPENESQHSEWRHLLARELGHSSDADLAPFPARPNFNRRPGDPVPPLPEPDCPRGSIRIGIELGSGEFGFGGLALAAASSAHAVALTDVSSSLGRLSYNANLNLQFWQEMQNVPVILTKELDWTSNNLDAAVSSMLSSLDVSLSSQRFFSSSCFVRRHYVIVASDIVWLNELIQPLVGTIRTLFDRIERIPQPRSASDSSSPTAVMYLAHQERSRPIDRKFFSALEKIGFDVSPVPQQLLHHRHRHPLVTVYRIVRVEPSGKLSETGGTEADGSDGESIESMDELVEGLKDEL